MLLAALLAAGACAASWRCGEDPRCDRYCPSAATPCLGTPSGHYACFDLVDGACPGGSFYCPPYVTAEGEPADAHACTWTEEPAEVCSADAPGASCVLDEKPGLDDESCKRACATQKRSKRLIRIQEIQPDM